MSRQEAADIEVMGMLETRALDFDHVIILGTTEGQLPTPWNANSFIPWEVRSLYHLPGREHHEALFAYHFYRLLQRARKVDLIYQLNGEGLGTPSPSRYLLQLESELPRWHPATRISKKDWLNHPSDRSAIPWVIPGMATINERIRTHLAAGLSPSALNTWINCPLDFYFQYVARLGEPEEVEETTGSATTGTIIHHVLEHFYIRHVGGFPSVSEIETFQHQLDGAISTAFHEARIRYHSDGINYLVSRVVREMLLTFLEREKQVVTDAPVLMALEEELTYDLPAELTGGLQIRLKGKADRIERLGNVITIIDYKSGKVESKDITFSTKKGIERLFTQPELSKLRQILMYQLMYMRKHKLKAEQCRGVFISFVRQESGRQSALINGNHPDDDFMDTFESALVTHLLNLINSTEWQHNTESKYCAYCGVISEANTVY
ncbi:MAG: PD-(D/E)XK nuclease family protein [Flavobacteriales bacterium]|nr:PD-(D/E)XK nuclease family protein [Flavobacteriales bacterium]